MTKKVIAVDLDGTLLNSDSKLSEFTKETIKKFLKKDIMLSSQLDALIEWHGNFIKNWSYTLQ